MAANINDVCETHDLSVQVIKFNGALTKQASKLRLSMSGSVGDLDLYLWV